MIGRIMNIPLSLLRSFSINNEVQDISNIALKLGHVRLAHTDIKVPDFSKDMKPNLQNPNVKTSDSDGDRKLFHNLMVFSGLTMGLYSFKAELIREVMVMAPTADVLALARIEIDLREIPEGVSSTFKWRGKPLFIKHRTPDEIAAVRRVPLNILRDPVPDEERCQKPEWLVIIGVCTHLGCVPVHNQGDFGPGGYYCPCHGAHYDASGRTRKGPAPLNMAIPEHKFMDEHTLVVG